jgi:predicted transcriptional regulator
MESLKIQDYMEQRPIFFKGSESVVEAVEKLLETNNSGAVVIDNDKKVIGFLSEQDCIKSMLSSSYHSGELSKNVLDVMNKDVLTKKPYDSILELAVEMSGTKPKNYPVVDDNEQLVGTINRTKVLKALDSHFHSIYEHGHHFV